MAIIEAIATTYLEAPWTASVTFDDIPSTYEHLQVQISARDTTSDTFESVYMQLGDSGHSPVDTGANYSRRYLYGYTTSELAGVQVAQTNMWIGKIAAATSNSGFYGTLDIDIVDYANANKFTTINALNFSGIGTYNRWTCGSWNDVSVVNAIKIYGNGNLGRGTEMTLYGLKSS
jgi:hypothetical protein